jgi:hypothetical protein
MAHRASTPDRASAHVIPFPKSRIVRAQPSRQLLARDYAALRAAFPDRDPSALINLLLELHQQSPSRRRR